MSSQLWFLLYEDGLVDAINCFDENPSYTIEYMKRVMEAFSQLHQLGYREFN